MHSNAEGGASDLALSNTETGTIAFLSSASGPEVRAGDYAVATPTKLLAGEVFVHTNPPGGNDCAFGVTGIG